MVRDQTLKSISEEEQTASVITSPKSGNFALDKPLPVQTRSSVCLRDNSST